MLVNTPLSVERVNNIKETVNLALDRNYLLTITELNRYLVYKNSIKITKEDLLTSIPGLELINELIVPTGLNDQKKLIDKSLERKENHKRNQKNAETIAIEFAREFLQYCPFVKSILLSGSLATGGYQSEDDIDFNFFCETGTKYITWLTAILLGIKYSIKYRKHTATMTAKTGLPVEKLICANVVWWESQSIPFERKDVGMAFELLLSKVIYNPDNYFDKILNANKRWIKPIFPQLLVKKKVGIPKPKKYNLIGKSFLLLKRNYYLKRFTEITSYKISSIIFSFVHWKRRNNLIAKNHYKKVAQLKYPYEVFQDSAL
jgi:hypothetical protein